MTVDSWRQTAQAILATRAYRIAIWLFRVANLVGVPITIWLFGFEAGGAPAPPPWTKALIWGVASPALWAGWGLLLRAGLLRPMFIDPDPRITRAVLMQVSRDLIPRRRPRS
ncbi:hypothetical protein GCM10022225_74310 [Plantactinospora mayteni]|uniref:Uncharacterized protein n=1 Tax=Plantactinospora mayteni TaxID=566021 RepID=A0ABQ4EW96_9ACTN|nr:hypothetical protein Pma05_54840 [Plantactinospora mayteni]